MKYKIKFIDGIKHASCSYFLNGSKYEITAKISEDVENQVHGECFRDNTAIQGMQNMLLVEIDDFFNEIEFLFYFLNGKDFKIEVFADAFIEQGKKHIADFGRMIDVDLEGYIDRIMKVMYTVNPLLKDEKGINLRKSVQQVGYEVFKDYIFIHRYSSIGQPELVKFSELI